MTDLIVGLGEIGKPIMQLLKERGFDVEGWDIINPTKFETDYNFIHICFPYSDNFKNQVILWRSKGTIIIHSTVKPGTSKELDVIYSPVRGVHKTMLDDLKHYTKYYSGPINKEFEKRFKKCQNERDSTFLEYTKIIVDTTYYGYLIAFRKYIDDNYSVNWSFAEEINEKLKNRPIMYNPKGPIGGHCVLPNLELLGDKKLMELIK